MGFVLMFHSILRWLIVIVAVVALVKLGMGWLRGQKFEKMDRGLVSGFSGMMDLQLLLGLIFLIGDGMTSGYPMYRIEHATTLILAVIVGHLPARWKKADDKTRFRNSFLAVSVAMLLIFAGVATLPGGWSR
ncbi:MAG: hypothetical protein HUU38_12765 [Anaerolineales bacterium]|nr:hypothetical protein [Anaerolineales bacterium]